VSCGFHFILFRFMVYFRRFVRVLTTVTTAGQMT